jgi:hypothetical protein
MFLQRIAELWSAVTASDDLLSLRGADVAMAMPVRNTLISMDKSRPALTLRTIDGQFHQPLWGISPSPGRLL